MRKLALLLVMAIPMALGGCGLHPIYAGGGSGEVAAGLRDVSVAPIPDKSGWLLRQALIDRLGNATASAKYRLVIRLDDDISGFGARGDDSITRERRTLRARYQLVQTDKDLVLLDATASSDVGIDVTTSEYATIAAEQTALERMAVDLSDRITTRVALYLRRQGK